MLIETNVITESLLLDLVADVPFPLEDRLKRRKRRLNTTEISAVPELPRTSPETRLIGMPNANISIGASYRKSPSTDASKDQNATVNAVNEVMGHTVRTLATFGPGTNLEGLRVTAEKQVETDTLLGPLQARRYELGDIDTTPLTIAGDNEEGFGARVPMRLTVKSPEARNVHSKVTFPPIGILNCMTVHNSSPFKHPGLMADIN
jgi:hypothetical protein